MSRPFINFQEVKDKVSIPDVLDKLGLLERFKEKNDVWTGVCPIPTHQHGPKPNDQQFKFDNKRGPWLWRCFGDCDRGGDVIELVKAIAQLSDEHVRFWFAEHFGDRLGTSKPRGERAQESKPEQPPKVAAMASPIPPLGFYLNLDPSHPYLEQRNVPKDVLERYGVGYCSRGVLNGYIAMPVHRWPKAAADENPVGYVGRWPGEDFDADDGRPRYKVPDGFEVSRVVYGLNQALDHRTDSLPLIVVEGPFKVFYLVQHGYPNTVSTLTSSVSDDQAAILASTKRSLVLLFDGNEAGYEGMRRGAAKLITQTYVRVIKLDEGVEPDHLKQDQLDELIWFAKPR